MDRCVSRPALTERVVLDLVPLAVEEQVWAALKAGASEVQVGRVFAV